MEVKTFIHMRKDDFIEGRLMQSLSLFNAFVHHSSNHLEKIRIGFSLV